MGEDGWRKVYGFTSPGHVFGMATLPIEDRGPSLGDAAAYVSAYGVVP